jgi:hypothetical protein
MTLVLKGVSKVVGSQTHIYPTDLELGKGTMNVLLGPTLVECHSELTRCCHRDLTRSVVMLSSS